MARIIIVIEDSSDGKVKVMSNPSFSDMAKMINSGDLGTSAHGYAMLCLREIRAESKKQGPMKLLLPRIQS